MKKTDSSRYMGFGDAPIKQEGHVGFYDSEGSYRSLPSDEYIKEYGEIIKSNYTYVERRIPLELVDNVHRYIDELLRTNGFPEDF